MAEPVILPDGVPQWTKDPGALKDYERDWSSWLGTDKINLSNWSAPDGIVIESFEKTDTHTTVWLSGGILGKRYRIKNTITTDGGRTEVASIEIVIQRK